MGLNADQGPGLCLFTWITFRCFRDIGGILGAPTTSDWMAGRWGLMLKPSKCQFVCLQVEYLGNLITLSSIHPYPNREVEDFPVPQSVKEVWQFLGIASNTIVVSYGNLPRLPNRFMH